MQPCIPSRKHGSIFLGIAICICMCTYTVLNMGTKLWKRNCEAGRNEKPTWLKLNDEKSWRVLALLGHLQTHWSLNFDMAMSQNPGTLSDLKI